MRRKVFTLYSVFILIGLIAARAVDNEPHAPIPAINVNDNQRGLRFDLYPAALEYRVLSGTNLTQPFISNGFFALLPYIIRASTNGTNYGYEWRATNAAPNSEFYRVAVTSLDSNVLMAVHVLNRLAYGPTPDELARVASIGAQAYIDEQLAPWDITEDVENSHTNFPVIAAMFCPETNLVVSTNAGLADLRAWHCLRAIGARRQLLEILLQFLDNHFVTQQSKSDNYISKFYDDKVVEDNIATQFEYLELGKWRAALLNPACTFYDLLKISAESPAMIIYLDTVTSRGDGTRVANENYARELLELFTFGVDNGYDQNDIVEMSRAWTGWTIDKVDFADVGNPHAIPTTTIIPGSTNTSTTTKSNLYGAWSFVFHSATNYTKDYHNASNKIIFPAKTVPARFGPPWAGVNYELTLTNSAGTNGIKDGYDVIAHLANQPFVEEYISVKLCRLLVHDNFPNPTTLTNLPEYQFYDYTAPDLSPEAQLVHACMMTWETNSPKGQIWKVIKTITDSELFRSHAAWQQKVKTPLEYAISGVRALRSSTNGSYLPDTFTADSDGYAIGGVKANTSTILTRAGTMELFDREAPDGYPESGPPWISAGTLAERVRWAQSLCIAQGESGHSGGVNSINNDAGNSYCNPVALLQAGTPSGTWTDAGAVADYFLGLLFPGEGAGNLMLQRQAAIDFLNSDDNQSPSPFSALAVSTDPSSSYDKRVRGMVGLMMASPRFQEQ